MTTGDQRTTTFVTGRPVANVVALLLGAAGFACLIASCGTDEGASAETTEPMMRHLGQVVVECEYSHSLGDDPIVRPGEPGQSHLHDFFGNVGVDAHSTPDSMLDDDTTCAIKQDTASYWAPALFLDGEQIVPQSSDAYYRAGSGVDHTTVEPLPFGLAMVSGDAAANAPQDLRVVGWGCGTNPHRTATPPTCGERSPLTLRVTFPDCWDGKRLDSHDHSSHMAVSGRDGCPESHPVATPQLEFVISYPFSGDPTGLRIASGDPVTAHADFLNAWDEDKLATDVRVCIRRDVVCGIAGLA